MAEKIRVLILGGGFGGNCDQRQYGKALKLASLAAGSDGFDPRGATYVRVVGIECWPSVLLPNLLEAFRIYV
jgi:hypothetical protein